MRSLLRDFPASLRRQFGGPRPAALFREFNGACLLLIGLMIFHLARRDIHDQLAKLDRVARTLETLRTHAGNMACLLTTANPTVNQTTAYRYNETDPLPDRRRQEA